MSARLIDGKSISADVRAKVAAEASVFQQEFSIVPHLAAVLVGNNPASEVYVRNKEKACQTSGLKSTLFRLSQETTEQELLTLVDELNRRADIHGILVQLPLPAHLDATRVLDAIHPIKDVDAFHPENVGRILQGRPRFVPCTPAGVMALLEASKIETAGMNAVVIGRSDIVGKPMAALLMQKGADATVTVCHSRTRELAAVCRQADLLIAAIGVPEFVTGDMIRPGAIIIDVGINRVGNRLVGDVAFEQAQHIAAAITPVPGGAGPMTIAMLLKNTLRAAQLQRGL